MHALTLIELLARSQGLLQWSVVVGSMKVEDVQTGGLQAGQRNGSLFQHTLSLQTALRAPGAHFGLYLYLMVYYFIKVTSEKTDKYPVN